MDAREVIRHFLQGTDLSCDDLITALEWHGNRIVHRDENHGPTLEQEKQPQAQDEFTTFVSHLHDPIQLQCILSNARRISGRRYSRSPNWVVAMELFGVGSTYGWKICNLAGIDGDSKSIRAMGEKK